MPDDFTKVVREEVFRDYLTPILYTLPPEAVAEQVEVEIRSRVGRDYETYRRIKLTLKRALLEADRLAINDLGVERLAQLLATDMVGNFGVIDRYPDQPDPTT